MKSLNLLAMTVLLDAGRSVGVSTTRDGKTLSSRIKHEGDSFLTITLPTYGKDFERCLDLCGLFPGAFPSFKRGKGGVLPAFMQGFLELVFDRRSGVLLDKPSIAAIRAIRQLTLMFAKIEREPSEKKVRAALDRYIQNDNSVRESTRNLKVDDLEDFTRLSSLVLGGVFRAAERRLETFQFEGRHGPGSTAEGLLGNKKYYSLTWTDRLEHIFPARRMLFPRVGYSFEYDIHYYTPDNEPPVKVVAVPKTMKSPRIIAMEPVCIQYAQQALLQMFYDETERNYLASQFISFRDQEPNQFLACEGSHYGDLATLDLSDASDLVSNQLVRAMFSQYPLLREAIDATRSRSADVRGQVIRLAKYASMGSATCFPIETYVFLTLSLLGIERSLGHRLTISDIKSLYGKVRVFGDDTIVPTRFASSVAVTLEAFGLRVNRSKSFWTGRFRESCGKDYYDGHDVSVVKLRHDVPSSRNDALGIISLSNVRNNLLGYPGVEQFCDRKLASLIPYPEVTENSSIIGRVTPHPSNKGYRWDSSRYRPLVKGVVAKSSMPVNPVDGSLALLKFFLERGSDPLEEESFRRSGRSSSVRLKTGWYPVH
jgi:hypothetical protein